MCFIRCWKTHLLYLPLYPDSKSYFTDIGVIVICSGASETILKDVDKIGWNQNAMQHKMNFERLCKLHGMYCSWMQE